MSKLNRKEFKSLLTEWRLDFINEMSRANKKEFERSKHDALKGESDVLFVHWFRPFHKSKEDAAYPVSDARRYMSLASERLDDLLKRKLNKKEIACNLLKPSDLANPTEVQFTHNYMSGSNWGYLGVVLKGYVTYGTLEDNFSVIDQTPSGERIRTYGYTDEERLERSEDYIDYDALESFKSEFDKDDAAAFNKRHDIEYSNTEFHIKPTRVLGVVLYEETEDAINSVIDDKLQDAEYDSFDMYEKIMEAFGEDSEDQLESIKSQELENIKSICQLNQLKLLIDPTLYELNKLK